MIRPPFPPLRLAGRTLLPLVQGGMGVGVSAHRLAGTVAACNAVGTISAMDLRNLHPDLVPAGEHTRDKALMDARNLIALDREIKSALELARGRGLVAVNVLKAVTEHPDLVRQACRSGAHAIVMGAGLPLDLPDLTAEFPGVALIPILSDSRGISIVLRKWMRKSRLPSAIVIEHPRYAGGHLGASRKEELGDPRFEFARVLDETRAIFKDLGLEREAIPLIVAGGVNTAEKFAACLALGADAVQLGTPFAVSAEGDAHPNFKKVLAEARPEEIVTFMSGAGLPARAVLTPWLRDYLAREERLQAGVEGVRTCATGLECLSHCGLRDGLNRAGQFCIAAQLSAAREGDVAKGLFFRGAEPLPFGSEIRPVRDIIDYFLSRPAA